MPCDAGVNTSDAFIALANFRACLSMSSCSSRGSQHVVLRPDENGMCRARFSPRAHLYPP